MGKNVKSKNLVYQWLENLIFSHLRCDKVKNVENRHFLKFNKEKNDSFLTSIDLTRSNVCKEGVARWVKIAIYNIYAKIYSYTFFAIVCVHNLNRARMKN